MGQNSSSKTIDQEGEKKKEFIRQIMTNPEGLAQFNAFDDEMAKKRVIQNIKDILNEIVGTNPSRQNDGTDSYVSVTNDEKTCCTLNLDRANLTSMNNFIQNFVMNPVQKTEEREVNSTVSSQDKSQSSTSSTTTTTTTSSSSSSSSSTTVKESENSIQKNLIPKLYLNHVKKLNLSFNHLTIFPFSIWDEEKIHGNTIISNEKGAIQDDGQKESVYMKFLSAFVMEVSDLIYLNISNNKLNDLSKGPELSLLNHLIHLDVSNNNIITIPEQLFSLINLQYLNLSRNKISNLSQNITNLKKLKELDVRFNMLKHLPSSLNDLTDLEIIRFERNPAIFIEEKEPTYVIPTFAGCSNLRYITWKGFKLESEQTLETIMNNCQSLEGLYLCSTSLRCIPPTISNISMSLRILNMNSNILEQIPNELASCIKLEKLYLTNNRIKTVPDFVFTKLTILRELDLGLNDITEIPSSLSHGKTIEKLSFFKNNIKIFPFDTISILSEQGRLRMLYIDRNPCTESLEEICKRGLSSIVQYWMEKNEKPKESKQSLPKYLAHQKNTTKKEVLMDRMKGCVYGQCLGDSIGLATEFMNRPMSLANYGIWSLSYEHFVRDAHRRRWIEGDFTDDTDQMLLILDTILNQHLYCKDKTEQKDGINEIDFANRLFFWIMKGYDVLGDDGGMGLGRTVKNVVTDYDFLNHHPHDASRKIWEQSGKTLAANGAIMRTSILGIYNYKDVEKVIQNTINICKCTHMDPRCIASCVAVTTFISAVLRDVEECEALKQEQQITAAKIDKWLSFSYEESVKHLPKENIQEFEKYFKCDNFATLQLDENSSIGYTYKAMGSAFTSIQKIRQFLCDNPKDLSWSQIFEDIITELTLEAGDSDSNGSVAGAMLGVLLGHENLPKQWLEKVPHTVWLEEKLSLFFNHIVFHNEQL